MEQSNKIKVDMEGIKISKIKSSSPHEIDADAGGYEGVDASQFQADFAPLFSQRTVVVTGHHIKYILHYFQLYLPHFVPLLTAET